MKRFILPFILIFSVLTAVAQEKYGVITGKINTADGKPAENVVIFIKGSNRVTRTSTDGAYRLTSPQGPQVLVVQPATRKDVEIAVKVEANQQIEVPLIRLKESAFELNEVVITGQYEPQSIRNSVYNTRTISSQMIKMRGATDLRAILNTELGVRFSVDAATGITDPKVMGVTGAGIKILLDGVPMMDRGTSRESIGQIDVNTIDRVEIIEGPMSVIYGTDAMAGVINIITKRGGKDNLSVVARVQEETVGKEYEPFSNKGIHNEYVGVNWAKNGWQVAGSGTRNNFGGWTGNGINGVKDWLPKDQWLTTASAGYKNGKLDIWYRFNGTDETIKYQAPYNPTATIPVIARKEYQSKRWFHQLQGSYLINDKLSFDGAASYTDYSRRTLSTNYDVNSGKETLSPDAGSQDKDLLSSTFFRGTVVYKVSPWVSLQPGVEFTNNQGEGNRIQGNRSINDYSFFLSSQLQLADFLQIKPGFRISKNSVYDAPPVIPSIHTKVKLGEDVDFRLSYARGFRAPQLRELYFIMKDSNHDIIGNPDLKAEYSNSYQASVSWAVSSSPEFRLSTGFSGFYNDYRDKIDFALQEDGRTNSYMNIGKYKTTGGEWNSNLYWKGLQANLGVSYIGEYNQLSEEKEEYGSSPEFVWSPEVNTSISYLWTEIGTNISLFYKFNGKQPRYIIYPQDGKQVARLTRVSPYHIADLTLNKPINKYLSINGGVRNLFDVTRIRNTSTAGDVHSAASGSSLFGFGRSYFLGLTMQWSKK